MRLFQLRSNDTSVSVVRSRKNAQTASKTQVSAPMVFKGRGRFSFLARPIVCSIGPRTFKHHEHASQLHMGPGSTVRHDTRAAQESHSCMLLQVFFVKGSRRNKRVHCGCTVLVRSTMLKTTYLQWRHWRTLALCGKVTGSLFCLCCRYDLTLIERMSLAFASVWASVAVGSWMMSKEQSP